MGLKAVRWKISQCVRGVMLKSQQHGWLRRAYAIIRLFPGVRWVWRRFFNDVPRWADFDFYYQNDGAFAQGASQPADLLLPDEIPEFGTDAFFEVLVSTISSQELYQNTKTGPYTLINNGLSSGGAERQIVYTLRGLSEHGEAICFIGQYLNRASGLDFHLPKLVKAKIPYMALEQVTQLDSRTYQSVSAPIAQLLSHMPVDMRLEILDMVEVLKGLRPRLVHLWQDDTSTKHAISALIAGVPKIILSGRNVNPTHFSFYLPHMPAAYKALASLPQVKLSNNSQAGAKSYESWLDLEAGSVEVVYNGFDISRWPERDSDDAQIFRASHGISQDSPLIVGVFRLSDEKRPLLWVDAAAKMREAIPHARFMIAGTGPMLAETRAHIKSLKLDGVMSLLGECKSVARLLNAADMFFMTSRKEGTPNALIEAQWYGVPSLTTEAGGAGEALLDAQTGRVVPIDADAHMIGAALIELWDNKALRDMARAEGPNFIQNRFGLDEMIARTLELYKAL